MLTFAIGGDNYCCNKPDISQSFPFAKINKLLRHTHAAVTHGPLAEAHFTPVKRKN